MTTIMRQNKEKEQTEKAFQPVPCLTQLEGRVGRGRNWVRNVGFTTCDAGGEGTGQGLRGEGGGAGGEKLENKRQEEVKHKQGSFTGKGKEEDVEKRNRPYPSKATRPKSSSMKKEWAVSGKALKLRIEENHVLWVNLKGDGQLSDKTGDGEQMCGMVPGLGSVSGCPRSIP